jgi:hypothetical protein
MFMSEAKSLPQNGTSERCLSHLGMLGFTLKIRLGWKGLSVANAPAYYKQNDEERSFISLTPGANVIKLFMPVVSGFS